MNRHEMALGIIKDANGNGIVLRVEGDALILSYAADHEPSETLAELFREFRADIVEALQGDLKPSEGGA